MPLPCTPGAAGRAGFAIARAQPGLTPRVRVVQGDHQTYEKMIQLLHLDHLQLLLLPLPARVLRPLRSRLPLGMTALAALLGRTLPG